MQRKTPQYAERQFSAGQRSRIAGGAPEVCASTGAACHSSGTSLSDTLRAIGLDPDVAQGTIRLSLGWYTTEEDVDRAANLLIGAWEALTQ